jgi:hypothetical protein
VIAVTCAHHWVIGPAEAGEALSRCQLCGDERVFVTVWDENLQYGTGGRWRNYKKRRGAALGGAKA